MGKLSEAKLSPLGKLIVKGLEGRGLATTGLSLAAVMGCSSSATTRWMTGVSTPSLGTLREIARQLDLEPDDVLAAASTIDTTVGAVKARSTQTDRDRALPAHAMLLAGPRSPLPPFLRLRLLDDLDELLDGYDQLVDTQD